MLTDIWTIFLKDLKLDFRKLENFISMLFFTLTILLVFAFALPPKMLSQTKVVAGVYWVAFLLAGILSLNKSFQLEKENGCMESLLITPTSRGSIFLGKMAGNVVFIMLVQLIVIPIYGILYSNVVISLFAELLFIGLLASVGFSGLGTLLAGLTSDIRFKEIMLPLLLFPLLVPLLLACVKISESVLGGSGLSGAEDWIRLLVGFDLIYLIISFLTFEYVMEL